MFKKSVFSKFSRSAFSLLITGFLFLTVLVNFPLEVKAAQSYFNFPCLIGIPTYFANDIDSTDVSFVRSTYFDLLLNSYGNDVSGSYMIICSHSPNSNTYSFHCFNIPVLSLSATELKYENLGQHYVEMYLDTSTGTWTGPTFYGGWVNNWTVNTRDLFLYGNGWVVSAADSNYYAHDTTSLTGAQILVWTDDADLVGSGSPDVTPVPDSDPLDNPDLDDPSPSNPPVMPQYDPTITLDENLANWFNWLGGLITYSFNKLFSNLKGFFKNLFDNLFSWLTNIKNTIANGFKNIVDNFTSLFKPFIDKVGDFIDRIVIIVDHLLDIGTVDGVFNIANILKYLFVPEVSALTATFLVHDEFGIINLFAAAWTFLQSTLPTLYNLPPTYSLHIPSCIYHGQQIGDFDVSFAWFQPYKSYTDIIISAFLVLGWIYWLVTSASGLLRGNTSVISDLSPSKTDEKGG